MTYTFAEKKERIPVQRAYTRWGISVRPGGDSRELAAYLSLRSASPLARNYRPVPANGPVVPAGESPNPLDFSSSLPTSFLSGSYRPSSVIRAVPRITSVLAGTMYKPERVSYPAWPTHPSSGQPISRASTRAHTTHVTNVFTRTNRSMEREGEGGKEPYHHSSNAGRLILTRHLAGPRDLPPHL